MRNLRLPASLATAVAAGALLLVVPGPTNSSAAANTGPKTTIVRGGIVKYAETAGGSPDYIFPGDPANTQSNYNLDQFQNFMYEPLWQSNFSQPTINYAGSIGNIPVWFNHDSAAVVTLKHRIWTNGTPVTTRDIIFDINLVRAAGSNWGHYVPGDFPYNVKRITIQGPYKMTFYFTKSYNPTYYIDNQLSDIVPMPQNVWDRTSLTGKVSNWDLTASGARKVWNFLDVYAQHTSTYSDKNPIWGVTDGAFKLASFGGSASPDIFLPNPRFSGEHARIAEFEELPFTSNAAEYDDLRSGNGAVTAGYVPSQDVPTIPQVKAAGYVVSQIHQWGVDYMVPNFKNPTLGATFSQLYIRQVLQRLVDQASIIQAFARGYATPTYGPAPIYPKPNPFADSYETHNPYPFSIAAAKSLLAAHGWRIVGGVQTCESSKCGAGVKIGTKLNISLLQTSGDLLITEQDELYQSDAAKVGIRISLKQETFDSIVANVGPCSTPGQKCSYQLVDYGGFSYSLYPSGGSLFVLGAGVDSGQYNNATVDSLVKAIRHSATLAPYYQYENLIAQQLPLIWMPTSNTISAVAKNLAGPGLAGGGGPEFGLLSPQLWYFTRT